MNGDILKSLVRSYGTRDDEGFLLAVQKIVEGERRQGHTQIAEDLGKLVKSLGQPSPRRLDAAALTPPRSRGDGSALVEVRRSTRLLREIVLGRDTAEQIDRVLLEHAHRQSLEEHGLTPKRKLLFFGPPGNGKTFCAEVLAGELSLPVFYVRFDALIASYLGETAANLRRVFDYAAQGLGIVFFDEFDALGRSRDSQDDVGEVRRVVNSFLQMLDGYRGTSLIIAATNHERLLDPALWRRFDALIYFPMASNEQLVQYFQSRFAPFRVDGLTPREAAEICGTCSYSDASRVLCEALKTMILSGKSALTQAMFRDAANTYRQGEQLRTSRGPGGVVAD